MAGLKKELWTRRLADTFKTTNNFLKELPVVPGTNDVESFHMTKVDDVPGVERNHNFTNPLSVETRTDKDVKIDMVTYSTKPTRVTDQETREIAYDKIDSIMYNHQNEILKAIVGEVLFNLAPTSASGVMSQIVRTTGAGSAGSKVLLQADIVDLKKKFDKASIPFENRVLVLHPEHVSHILGWSQSFQMQYGNIGSGQVINNFYGFKVVLHNGAFPRYVSATGFKGTLEQSQDAVNSIAFYSPMGYKAIGSTKMYMSAELPEYNGRMFSFTQYAVGGSINAEKYNFALVS